MNNQNETPKSHPVQPGMVQWVICYTLLALAFVGIMILFWTFEEVLLSNDDHWLDAFPFGIVLLLPLISALTGGIRIYPRQHIIDPAGHITSSGFKHDEPD
jgi:hypothetical protein